MLTTDWKWNAVAALLALGLAGSAFGQAKNDSALLRKIEDRQAIEQLLTGDYPRALDANDWKTYGSFFAKDGTLIMGGGATKETGPAAIQKYFESRPAQVRTVDPACPANPSANASLHVVSNLTLQIDGDTATDQAYYQTIVTRECKAVIGGAGHYVDTLKREDGHWKFLRREIIADLPPKAAKVQASAKQ